jgi:hypothetical protein
LRGFYSRRAIILSYVGRSGRIVGFEKSKPWYDPGVVAANFTLASASETVKERRGYRMADLPGNGAEELFARAKLGSERIRGIPALTQTPGGRPRDFAASRFSARAPIQAATARQSYVGLVLRNKQVALIYYVRWKADKIELTAHMSSSRRCPWRATPRQSIKVGPAKGLDRKQIAPSCSARLRVVSSGKAVMNMNGTP